MDVLEEGELVETMEEGEITSDHDQRLLKRPKAETVDHTEFILPIAFRDPLGPEERRSETSPHVILGDGRPLKRPKTEAVRELFPRDFVEPLALEGPSMPRPLSPQPLMAVEPAMQPLRACKQFWKAGDYERERTAESEYVTAGIEHVRVHPKFLHSNATSHKWALGALAELLDNSMDEVCHGATFVNVDMLINNKDGSKMLLVEDDGGGMDPEILRQCMSLGYSRKSKSANTIGQYGNGFKTSTMRLGADVIVFSRCLGKDGRSPTQSIGMLSYTFLQNTGKEDIVVPMVDYKKDGEVWNKMTQSTSIVWYQNLETIVQWSPYFSEDDLLQQFSSLTDHGTRIVIYNLWEDDQEEMELDFDTEVHDIQVRGVNRDEKKIEMAKKFPNSSHFLLYQHSLRSYVSILYLRLPYNFKMILRGKLIENHDICTDMMLKETVTYKPTAANGMVAVVTLGFVKDAKDHIDVQGFNVYHKNRLIKPFWRIWHAAGSDGRGVIGVLEADFIEPAHDKQGFERTTVLARLESRLVQIQKNYWKTNCHKIGYAPRIKKKVLNETIDNERSHEAMSVSQHLKTSISQNILYEPSPPSSSQHPKMDTSLGRMSPYITQLKKNMRDTSEHFLTARKDANNDAKKLENDLSFSQTRMQELMHATNDRINTETTSFPIKSHLNLSMDLTDSVSQRSIQKESIQPSFSAPLSSANYGPAAKYAPNERAEINRTATGSQLKEPVATSNIDGSTKDNPSFGFQFLLAENKEMREMIKKLEVSKFLELKYEDRIRVLTDQVEAAVRKHEEAERKHEEAVRKLEEAERKLRVADEEQGQLINIIRDDKIQRDIEEAKMKKNLGIASVTIQMLLKKQSSNSHTHIKQER